MRGESAKDKLARMTEFERELWARNLPVAGIDEVGRGPLAGPVAVACVILPPEALIEGVDDSKKLSPKKREALNGLILARASYAKVAWEGRDVIDEINILNATKRAMERAAAGAVGAYFLVDAVEGLRLPGESRAIIGGDAASYVIAAASIVAKVARDSFMEELDEKYPQYGFARNKGYGTAEHIAALKKYGPCPEHRRSFIGKILAGGR